MDDIAQRTAEWHAARCGKFTASRFSDVISRNKRTGEKLKAWEDLCWKIACERITNSQDEGPDSFALRWGREVEPYAREAYEFATGNIVTESGFIVHPDFDFVGCSPDGLIGQDGGIEMKSPKQSTIHLERLVEGMPEEFMPQVQGCMWVTGRQWWDFVSYDPRMPEHHRIFIHRVQRDSTYISTLESCVLEANERVKAIIQSIEEKHGLSQ